MVAQVGVPRKRLEVVVNRYDGSDGLVAIADVEQAIQKPVFARIPNDFQVVSQFLNLGQPTAALDENNPIRAALQAMGRQIVCGEAPAAVGER